MGGVGPLNDLRAGAVVDGDSAVVELEGDIDCHNAASVEALFDSLVRRGVRHVVADLSGVSFLGSTGLAVLGRALVCLRTEGGELTLRSPSPRAAKVMEIAGFDRLFGGRAAGGIVDATDGHVTPLSSGPGHRSCARSR